MYKVLLVALQLVSLYTPALSFCSRPIVPGSFGYSFRNNLRPSLRGSNGPSLRDSLGPSLGQITQGLVQSSSEAASSTDYLCVCRDYMHTISAYVTGMTLTAAVLSIAGLFTGEVILFLMLVTLQNKNK